MKPEIPYEHKTIAQLLEELAREVPTLPAGGCVLALLGALAFALERFVAQVALHRTNNPDVDKRLKELILRLGTLQDKCVGLMDRDVEEYDRIIRITQLPKNNRSAPADREKAIQKASIRAAKPPMMLMKYALEMLEIGFTLIREEPKVAIADAAVAMEIAHSCLRGGLWITEANLARISDIEFIKQKRERLEGLQKKAEDLYLKTTVELRKQL